MFCLPCTRIENASIANLDILCYCIICMRSVTHPGNNSRKNSFSLQPDYHPPLLSAPTLYSVFKSPRRLLIMDSQTLRKRAREPEDPADSIDVRQPKRYHGEETDQFLHLLQLDQTLADDEEEECSATSEELVKGVMRSQQEKIAVTCSPSYPGLTSGDKLPASNISSGHEGQNLNEFPWVDLCYLLEASDDDLGIPPNLLLESKGEVYPHPKETSDSFSENFDLESWYYENDFNDYQQFELFEDAWYESQLQDFMNGEIENQGLLFDE